MQLGEPESGAVTSSTTRAPPTTLKEALGVIRARDATIAELCARVASLEEQVAKLLARLGENSSNTSKPPSTDSPFKRPPPKPPTGRKPGRTYGRRAACGEMTPR